MDLVVMVDGVHFGEHTWARGGRSQRSRFSGSWVGVAPAVHGLRARGATVIALCLGSFSISR